MLSSPRISTILVIFLCAIGTIHADNCVQTKQGEACGFEEVILNKTVVNHWGIPYAQPPIGDLRFLPPLPQARWNATVDATVSGKGCLQNHQIGKLVKFMADWQPPLSNTSEDCLFLDIRAPKGAQNLPVMLSIHGGGFSTGSGSIPAFRSPGLALEGDIIYVSINYRLGMLGFGYLDTDEMPGNVGLLDQRMALQWVKENIASFGGDPEQITIFGESAGGGSVAMHLVADDSRQLFKTAIVQSGTLFSDWAFDTSEDARANTLALAKVFKCENTNDSSKIAECLRNVPGQNLTIASPTGKSFSPVTPDTSFFGGDGDAFVQLVNRSFADFNVIIGSTKDESSLFLPFFTGFALKYDDIADWNISRTEYHAVARTAYGLDADNATVDALLAEYDAMPNITDVDRLIKSLSDYSFHCPTLQFASILSQSNPDGVYLYRFDYVAREPIVVPTGLGACHTTDVAFTLGAPLTDDGWASDDKLMSREMLGYWSNFSKKESPSSDWPPVTSSKEPKMRILQLGSSEVTTKHQDKICQLISEIQPAYKFVKIEDKIKKNGSVWLTGSIWVTLLIWALGHWINGLTQ